MKLFLMKSELLHATSYAHLVSKDGSVISLLILLGEIKNNDFTQQLISSALL